MFDGVDPPKALQPKQSLIPNVPTSASVPPMTEGMPESSQTPAPAQPISNSQPVQTQSPSSPISMIDSDTYNSNSQTQSTSVSSNENKPDLTSNSASSVQTNVSDTPIISHSNPHTPSPKIPSLNAGLSYAPGATNPASDGLEPSSPGATDPVADALVKSFPGLSAIPPPNPGDTAPSPVSNAGEAIFPVAESADEGIVIGGTSIPPGTLTTVNGHIVSAGSSDFGVDSSVFALPSGLGGVVQAQSSQEHGSPVIVDGQPLVKAVSGDIVIGGTTIMPGSQTTVNGHIIFVGPSNIGIDGSTYAWPLSARVTVQTPLPKQLGAPLEIDDQPIVKAAGEGVIIGGSTTLAPDQQTIISGHVVSAGATNVVVDGSSYALPTNAGGLVQSLASQPGAMPVILDGQPLLKEPNGGVIVNGDTTVSPGSPTTIHGHVVSVGTSGVVIDGSSSYPLPTSVNGTVQGISPGGFSTPSPLLVAGQALIEASSGGLIIGGSTTLTPGAQATLQGHVISVASSDMIVGGDSTYAIPTSVGATVTGVASQQQHDQGLSNTVTLTNTNTKISASVTSGISNPGNNPLQILSGAEMENSISSAPRTRIETISSHGTLAFVTTVITPTTSSQAGATSGETPSVKNEESVASLHLVRWRTLILTIRTPVISSLAAL